MATIIQIRRDTGAAWTAANPILADGEWGIEKDSTPKKLKIGNGTDNWNTLPYFTLPSSDFISQVITNGVTDKAPSEDAVFDALALKAPLASPALTGNPTAPTQSANDNSTRIATTAYADAKVADAINNGTTTIAPSQNAVFDALDLKVATFYFGTTQFNPADSTSYYFGTALIAATATQTDQDFKIPFNCTVVAAVFQITNATNAGSNESASFSLRNLTTATSHALGNSSTNFLAPVTGTAVFTGLNISVASTDDLAIQFTSPAYATNPVATIIRGFLVLKPSI